MGNGNKTMAAGADPAAEERAIMAARAANQTKPLDRSEAAAKQKQIDAEARTVAQTQEREALLFAAEMQHRQKEAEKLRVLPPIMQAVHGSVARPDDECVLMNFPRAMFIWAEPLKDAPDGHITKRRLKVAFGAGVQKVPVSLKDDWYLASSGVKEVGKADNGDRADGRPPLKADRSKGPTVEEYVLGGYDAYDYPPGGFDSKSSEEEVQAARDEQDAQPENKHTKRRKAEADAAQGSKEA